MQHQGMQLRQGAYLKLTCQALKGALQVPSERMACETCTLMLPGQRPGLDGL